MNFLKNKSKNFKKDIFYGISALLILITSATLSFGNLKNFNWKNIFDRAGVSDTTTRNYGAEMSVHFLNVGKADCAYITCDGHNILIDAADKEPTDVVTEYLKRQQVKEIDLVVATHPHRDHIGQMDKIIKEFKIGRFIESKVSKNKVSNNITYENMQKALTERHVKVITVSPGENFEVGNMKVEIFGPIYPHEKENNNSIVLKVTYGLVKFLFMGDAEKAEEEELMKSDTDLKSTVLKVGHHGSNTSSTYKFLGKVNPQYAVISVGPDKSNLPKEKVINRLKKFCDNIYRTDENGTIIFLTNGKDIAVRTEK